MVMSTSLRLAQSILNGYDSVLLDFQNITLSSKVRFENADWHGMHKASRVRLEIYKQKVEQITELIHILADGNEQDLELWQQTKNHFIELIAEHRNFEVAETFFNSIFCQIFDHKHINDHNAFVLSSQLDELPKELTIYTSYRLGHGLTDLLNRILDDYAFKIPYEDRARDVRNILEVVKQKIMRGRHIDPATVKVDVLDPVFYRNKAAYLVGRIYVDEECVPFVLPILNNENGSVYIDTLICNTDDVSIIFSFTRSFFMADAHVPSQIVAFLKMLMPHKELAELYSCIGFKKHSKTMFYRSFVNHLNCSDDKFVVAPGIKGMVMSVFTLPSYGIVFKVIKDKFTPPKDVTQKVVREKYRLVTRHDRVGRMADTQEFSSFSFDRARFSEELLTELETVAPSKLVYDGDKIIIKHLYTERRMQPLNLYLLDASEEQIWAVMDEYGNAIKQLAAANIFPGDMLLKNFGVTRHGRVVFYDYDEICFITDCNFRRIPKPRTEEQEMASTPWYTVADNDIFPEEFRLFFSGNPKAKEAFDAQHSDLYDVSYWQQMQESIRAGRVMDVFPYRRRKRFSRSDS